MIIYKISLKLLLVLSKCIHAVNKIMTWLVKVSSEISIHEFQPLEHWIRQLYSVLGQLAEALLADQVIPEHRNYTWNGIYELKW